MGLRLREQREHALLWRQLATIALDAPLDSAEGDFLRLEADSGLLDALAQSLRFGPLTRRRMRAAAGLEETVPPPSF